MTTMLVLVAALAVDFTAEVGKVRPELHSAGFGPKICNQSRKGLDDLKAMGFKAARTHDWALINSGQRVCDYFHIFPMMNLDPKDPSSYVFGPTDYLLKRTREEMGVDVFFRLGTSIEHSGNKIHFNAAIPTDPDKVIESFAGTVRHYNRGWGNGYEWGIKYWEIWNEPEGIESMWTPPGGIDWTKADEVKEKHALCRRTFVDFFVKALKRLKGEFGDTIKVGGPALQTYREDWFRDIFTACRTAGVKPDFISWHSYENDPMKICRQADEARKLCDEFGFANCELIVNEWHYFGENYTWADMDSADPKDVARVWEGPDGHNSIRSACYLLSVLANLQVSKLDQAYYYGCNHVGDWGFKDKLQRKYRVFYALKLFGDIVKNYTTICGVAREGTVTTLAVKDAKGKVALLVVDYGGTKRTIDIPVKGLPAGAKPKAILLDYTNDLEPGVSGLADGILTVVKPDFHSAAFFVTFE